MKLIRYRDQESPDYMWFWVNYSEEVASPYFKTESEANQWLQDQMDAWDNWKPCKDIL